MRSPDPGAGLRQLARRWASPILATLADAFSDGGRDINVDYLNAVALPRSNTAARRGLRSNGSRTLATGSRGTTTKTRCCYRRSSKGPPWRRCASSTSGTRTIKARLVKHGAIEDDRPA